MSNNNIKESQVVAQTRCWVEAFIVRHNLCPFAHKPFQQETIRYTISSASEPKAVVEVLMDELLRLRDRDPELMDTTLLIAPNCFADFRDYNEFLDVVDLLIAELRLEGVIQVASFHPDYQFADLEADDVRNYTNRSLYPMFHLILEESIERARATHPDVQSIPQTNMDLLEKQGVASILEQLNACREIGP
ncbi:MAG: DUF1415 domain-containing protein [Gammaproteobacteria bacterium]|nr:DUF1415 domain-containing protein [Gammaproteobacteria bacterium]